MYLRPVPSLVVVGTCFPIQNITLGVYLRLVLGQAVASIYFPTKNIKLDMYLRPVPGLAIISKYLFSYLKHEAWHISKTWLVKGSICFPT